MYIFGIKNIVFGDRKRSFAYKIASIVTSIPSLNIILLPNMIQQWGWSQVLTTYVMTLPLHSEHIE